MAKAPSVSRPWFWWIVLGLLVIIVALIIWWVNHQTDWVFWTLLIGGIAVFLIGIIWWMMEFYPGKSAFNSGSDISQEHYNAFIDGERVHQDDIFVGRPAYSSSHCKSAKYPSGKYPPGQRGMDRALEEKQAAQRRSLEQFQSMQRGAYRGPSGDPVTTQMQDRALEARQAAARQALEQRQAAERASLTPPVQPAYVQPVVQPVYVQPAVVQPAMVQPVAMPPITPVRNSTTAEVAYEQQLAAAESAEIASRRQAAEANAALNQATAQVNNLRSSPPPVNQAANYAWPQRPVPVPGQAVVGQVVPGGPVF